MYIFHILPCPVLHCCSPYTGKCIALPIFCFHCVTGANTNITCIYNGFSVFPRFLKYVAWEAITSRLPIERHFLVLHSSYDFHILFTFSGLAIFLFRGMISPPPPHYRAEACCKQSFPNPTEPLSAKLFFSLRFPLCRSHS